MPVIIRLFFYIKIDINDHNIRFAVSMRIAGCIQVFLLSCLLVKLFDFRIISYYGKCALIDGLDLPVRKRSRKIDADHGIFFGQCICHHKAHHRSDEAESLYHDYFFAGV